MKRTDPLIEIGTALNSGDDENRIQVMAMNIELTPDGKVPEWVQLLPEGQIVQGRDGRTWINDNPQGIIESFKSSGRDLVIDWEHSTELRAPEGEEAPAAGWGREMEVRGNGAIWARSDWTQKGFNSIDSKEYRYLSPVVIFETESRRIVAISSVALTNKPNLRLQALNHEGESEENPMLKKVLAALGLSETATEAEALNAISTMKTDLATARNRAETPSLDKFVPRADYDSAVTRATNAEQKLADREKSDHAAEVDRAINAAKADGKISPATEEFYRKSCQSEGGLDAFKAFVKDAPVVAKPEEMRQRQIPDGGQTSLNAEERQICRNLGISAEEYLKTPGMEAA